VSFSRAAGHLARDTRHAFRAFGKHFAFTAIAVGTIGLGMGFNTTLFSVVYGALFRPLPVADPGTLFNVYVEPRGLNQRASYNSQAFQSFTEFTEIREGSTTSEVAGIQGTEVTWKGTGATNRSVRAQLVSDNLLSMIGARPVLGRFFHPEETARPGSALVVVLSHRLWREELGGDPGVVGSTITLNRNPFTVIGVADSASRGPLIESAELWIPITMQALTRPGESLVDDPHAAWIQTFARPRPGQTAATMLTEMRVLGHRAVAAGDSAVRTRISVVPAAYLNFPDVREDSLPVLSLIWLAFAMILIVACANVANMLLARGLSRRREIAVRLAIGANRGRLLRQLLTESAWLGLLGGGLGLALGYGAGRLAPTLFPAHMGIQLDFSPDGRVLAFAAVVSLLSGLVFGLLPALQATGFDLTPSLKADAGSLAGSRPKLRAQTLLVGLQVTICVILLVNAGLVVRGFNRALAMDAGKPLDHLVIAKFDLRQQQYTPERAEQLFQRLSERLSAVPTTVAVGTSMLDPETSNATNVIRLADSVDWEREGIQVAFDEVGAGYFAASELRVLAGRTFTEDEVRRGDRVVVIDRRFADQYFAGQPLGKRILLGSRDDPRSHEVIGVVNSTVPMTVGREPSPTYFVPIHGLRHLEGKLLVRYRGPVSDVLGTIRRATAEADPDLLVTLTTIEANVAEALLPVRIASWSLTAIGGLALTLASIGLFGVIAYSVGRRTREIAIRLALGAAPGRVLRLLLWQGLRPVAIGTAIGLVAALVIGHLIRAMIYGLSPFDPVTIVAVLAAVAGASWLAFWIPARRAAAVQPAAVLRED
jgi:predicted permease